MGAIVLPEFGIPIKRKAPAFHTVGNSSRNSAPEAGVSAPNSQQVRRPNPRDPPQVNSQVTPEETPATVLPNKNLNLQNLGLKTSIRDRLSRFPHITVTKSVPSTPSQSIDPPLAGLAKMNTICDKYSHLWR